MLAARNCLAPIAFMALEEYKRKRNFARTREPRGAVNKSARHRFVVQEHHASRLHFDFRLEMAGVLKSWAVPKGPSLDPRDKRLAVEVEDHPVSYINFEGEIAQGNYGAGQVRVWDIGTYSLVEPFDPLEQLDSGKLRFVLHGKKLHGEFTLARMGQSDERGKGRAGGRPGKQWLLIKSNDKFAKENNELVPILRGKTRTRPNRSRQGPSVRKMHVEGNGKPVADVLKARNPKGDCKVEVNGDLVELTSLERVYFPEKGYTKADLLRYYNEVAETMSPYLKNRPLILKRFPLGVNGKFFFQHDVDEVPDYVETYTTEALGHTVDYVVCNNTATLLYLANKGVIPIHPWHSRVEDIGHPDWIVFDLDPGKVEFEIVREVALATKQFLDALGLESYPKTSGSRGMHVYVPIELQYTYDEIARFAERVAKGIVRENPDITTIVRSLSSRKPNRVYVDHLQNAQGKTIVAAYSVRERAAATVSAPLEWKEVRGKVMPGDFTIKTMPKRLREKGDLFADVLKNKQRLEEAIEKLDAPDQQERKKK